MQEERSSSSTRATIVLPLLVVAACILFVALLRAGRGGDDAETVHRETEGPVAGDAGRRLAGSLREAARPAPGGDGGATRDPPVWKPVVPEGDTRFQRRLSLGDGLPRLAHVLEEAPEEAPAVGRNLAQAWDALLPFHDGLSNLDPVRLANQGAFASEVLRYLAHLPLDRGTFRLHAVPEVEDAFGRGALLRVWTTEASFDASALARAHALLGRLLAVAGGADEAGFDVVAAPDRGEGLFHVVPRFPFPVAGYYALKDDFCVIGTRYDAAFLPLLLDHELVHAWQARHVGPWASRALEEGIAEYLGGWTPADPRLQVPTERLRDNFAALRALLGRMDRAGLGTRGIRPAALVRLDPLSFYALGHFGYLLAQALIAYVGPDTLETALTLRSEDELARAVSEVPWADFLAFLGREAASGDAGRVSIVGDRSGAEAMTTAGKASYRGLAAALSRVGVRFPASWKDRDLVSFTRALPELANNDAADVSAVFAAILAGAMPPRIAIDGTQALRGAFHLAAPGGEGPGGLSLERLDQGDRLGFATAFVEEVDRLLGRALPTVTVVRDGRGTAAWPIEPAGESFSAWTLRSALGDDRRPLVLLVASKDALRDALASALSGQAEETVPPGDPRVDAALAPVLAGRFQEGDVLPSGVLVVDLADGQGDAWAIAQAFHLRLEGRGVAYWNPQQPLR